MAQMNLSRKQKQTQDTENKLMVIKAGWGSGWRGMDWELGVSRYKLSHIEWVDNKVLL